MPNLTGGILLTDEHQMETILHEEALMWQMWEDRENATAAGPTSDSAVAGSLTSLREARGPVPWLALAMVSP